MPFTLEDEASRLNPQKYYVAFNMRNGKTFGTIAHLTRNTYIEAANEMKKFSEDHYRIEQLCCYNEEFKSYVESLEGRPLNLYVTNLSTIE